MKSVVAAVVFASTFAFSLGCATAASPWQSLTEKLHWRSIGPYIGGRSVAVAGVPSQPNRFYMGGVEGGVWRSDDYGQTWTNVTDGKIPGIASPIGALAVAPSNPEVIYAGTGESDIRSDFDTGDGVYKSNNAGKTWTYAGLRETHMTADLAVDPRDANVVYAASMGHVFVPNADRGIYKTTDGGKHWRKVLYVDERTGGVSLSMNAKNPREVYAATWQAQRVPWKLTSGGPGSALWKTSDGGAHWTKISTHRGFPTGMLGKIGVSVAASNPRIVYAIVQAHDGGVFRSNDAGMTWRRVNDEMKLRQRAFYYTAIYVDPVDPNVAYAPQVDGVYRTTDGGRTFAEVDTPHGDNHIVWINPRNHRILLVGNDGGGTVSIDGGDRWSSEQNQPTGQYYHVAIDDQFPFHVFGAAQDEGAYEGPSAAPGGGIGAGEWHTVALGESTFVAPEPGSPFVTYGSGYYSSFVRFDRITGNEKNVSPYPRYMAGATSAETQYRFGWTHPIFFSPADPRELLVAAQVVFSSVDRGRTWAVLSPDLTRNDPSTEGPTGGSISLDQTGAETFPDIASLAASPLDANVLWAGSADGLVHVTTDHGAHWNAVTPPQLPQWAQISSIEPSHTAKSAAFLTASRYMWDDFHPYVYATKDYGAHWTAITDGLPANQYAFVVRQDPREPRLLVAGTRSTVYASLDGGAHWQALTSNLPGVQVRDLAFDSREGELVAATHGRAFWIMDNVALLEQLARGFPSASAAWLFEPETAWLTQSYGGGSPSDPNTGENPPYGATVFFTLPHSYDGKTPATLTFADALGNVIRTFALHRKGKHDEPPTPEQQERLDANQLRDIDLRALTAVTPDENAFRWDMRYAPGYDVPGWHASYTDDWPNTIDGPTIVPGKYTVTLTYGSQRHALPLDVRLDPRLHPATGDLEARLALERDILATIDDLDRSIAAAMARRSTLQPAQRASVNAEIGELVQLDIHSSEADSIHENKIREQLAFLMNSLEGAYDRPTAAEYSTYRDLKALAEAGEAKLQRP